MAALYQVWQRGINESTPYSGVSIGAAGYDLSGYIRRVNAIAHCQDTRPRTCLYFADPGSIRATAPSFTR